MLDKLLFLVALAGVAVVFADVLVRPGMLLEPVQRWLREWYRAKAKGYVKEVFDKGSLTEEQKQAFYETRSFEIDELWWWKPLWGCYACVSGQWGFWGYLIRYRGHYNFFEHIAFTAFTIIAAIILHKWTQDN
jgi:hypothetical protein